MTRFQAFASLAVLISAAALVSCDASRPRPSVALAPTAPFSQVLQPVRTVVLQTPPSYPIVGLSGIDLAADGKLVVTDLSDGSAQLFAADGRLLKVLGRKGYGPGEFQIPLSPRFGPDGRIHVLGAWGKSWTNAAAVISTRGTVAIPFVRGTQLQGDSSTLAVRRPDGTWANVHDAPFLVRGAHGYFVGVTDPLADTLEVVIYRPQPR